MTSKAEKLSKWSSIIATLGTTILALTSLITVTVTLNAWKIDREASRPYLSLKESPSVDVKGDLNLEFKFYNVGIHPAAKLSSQTVIFHQDMKEKPVHNDVYTLVNEIPKDMSSSLAIELAHNEVDITEPRLPPYYIVVHLVYTDPIIEADHRQTLYYKWNGMRGGEAQPIVHVEVSERDKILEYLKTQNINPL